MSRSLFTRRVAPLSGALAGLAAAAISIAPAQAEAATTSCPADSAVSQPFSAWGDTNSYRLLAGGDFENGAPGWTLSGRAALVAGSDPFALAGTPGESSLSLPAGASAQSPFTCVDATQPTFRFVDVADSSGASAAVSVVYQTLLGPATVPVGVLGAGESWSPSPAFQNGAAIAGLLHGGTAQMAIRFTALSGTTQLDDVFVDPRSGWGG